MDDLGLDITPRLRGRSAKPATVAFSRELKEGDLALLDEEKGSKPEGLVKRLTSRHHALARVLASGIKPGEAGIICGYSTSRVSILQADPSFRELVEFYRQDVVEAFRGVHEKISGLSSDALEELQDRLEEEPDSFSNAQLLELVKTTADRSGNGPTATQVNVNVGLAEKLQSARERAAKAREIHIDHKEDE